MAPEVLELELAHLGLPAFLHLYVFTALRSRRNLRPLNCIRQKPSEMTLPVYDYTRLNEAVGLTNFLVNMPSIHTAVRPTSDGTPLDLSFMFQNPRTCIMGTPSGGVLFQHLG